MWCMLKCFPQYVTLRTRYSELMTLTSQYIKFITDTQRRLEDEEVRDNPRGPTDARNPLNLTQTTEHHRPTDRPSAQSTHPPKPMHAPTHNQLSLSLFLKPAFTHINIHKGPPNNTYGYPHMHTHTHTHTHTHICKHPVNLLVTTLIPSLKTSVEHWHAVAEPQGFLQCMIISQIILKQKCREQ